MNTKLHVARYRARLYRSMLPSCAQVNDKRDSFCQEDIDVLLDATEQVEIIPIEDIRTNMRVQMTVHFKRYVDALAGRKPGERDRTKELVAHLTRGWDAYRIHGPNRDVRGINPLQDYVEDLLGAEGVQRLERKGQT